MRLDAGLVAVEPVALEETLCQRPCSEEGVAGEVVPFQRSQGTPSRIATEVV